MIFSTLVVLAICGLGARLIGPRRAFIAALFGTSSIIFLHHGRLAETDFTFTLFVVLASLSGYAALTRTPAGRWWLLTGCWMGIGFMVKGPAALVVPILACATYAISTPAKRSFKIAGPLLGIAALCLAMALPWYAAVLMKSTNAAEVIHQIRTEVDKNYVEAHRREPLLFYVYMLPEALAPWCLLLPFALWAIWKKARHHSGTRFLLGWFASAFIALTVNPGKREHYMTLLFAQSVLIMGWYAVHLHRQQRPALRKALHGFLLFLLAVLALSGIAAIAAPFVRKEIPMLLPVLIGSAVVFVSATALRGTL